MRFALFFLFFCAFVLPTDFVSITFAMSQADSTKRADTHLSFGVRYLKIKRYKDAQVQLLKSWSYRPKSRVYDDKRAPTNARYLGELFKKIEDYESAIMWYEKALEIDPKGNYQYANLLHRNLIFLYSEKNQYEKALSHAKKWFELEPNNAEVIKLVEQLRLLVRDDEPLPEMEIILNKNDDNYIELAEKLEKEAILQESYGNHRLSFDYYEKLRSADTLNVFFLEKTIELGEYIGKSKNWLISRLEKLHYMQPDNIIIINQLSILTQDTKWSEKQTVDGSKLASTDIFGLKKGMSVKQVENLNFGKLVHDPDGDYNYYVTNPKKPKDFYDVAFVIDHYDGLLKVAFQTKVKTNRYGDELKRRYRELRDILKKKYGRNKYGGEEVDRLKSGSIWNSPEDFVMGLAKGERHLSWRLKDIFTYNKWQLDQVAIQCRAENIYSDATIDIHYEFKGFKEYLRFKKDSEASQF